MTRRNCVICGGSRVSTFVDTSAVPVFCNQLCHSRADAEAARKAEVRLGYCGDCGHVYNTSFDASLLEYGPEYENSLHFSGLFREYADRLVDDLLRRYELRNKRIVEVGCGRGDFLRALCRIGRNRGFGFDMSYPGELHRAPDSANVTISREAFTERHHGLSPDFLCARHVLEHVAKPVSFLSELRAGLSQGTPLYVEVPNVLFTLRDGGIWDIIYEHFSYFSPDSLWTALERCGFDVETIEEAFDGQFLAAHARAGTPSSAPPHQPSRELSESVATFARDHGLKLGEWRTTLDELAVAGRRVVTWGAGSKGSTFANLLATAETIPYVVDLNPRKHGMFVAGTGARIVPPEFLAEYQPDVVVIMNPNYRNEIAGMLQGMGLSPEIRTA